MKRTKKFLVASASTLLFLSIVFISSCVKERDVDTYAAEDAVFALWAYDNAMDIANEANSLSTGDNLVLYKTTGNCSRVINTPGELIISFGDDNCLCNDGRERRGKIIVNYEGNYDDTNAVHNYTFQNYFINDNEINGTQTVTAVNSEDGVQQFAIVIDGKLDIEDSLGALTYQADLTRRFVEGNGTIQWGDDVYEISGTAQGLNIYGNNYAFSIVEPVVKANTLMCRFFNKGILEVQPQGRTFRSIDFGDGSCDKSAIVTIDRKQHNIDME